MRQVFLTVLLAIAFILQAGCATDFRAGGRNAGVEAGVAVGAPAAPVVIYDAQSYPPPR